ncbi:MAG: RNA methyltransferase [Deltaproteobacteria bacterium]|nr:RNA methyltransferase [Deltaproteobacteria bacterium]
MDRDDVIFVLHRPSSAENIGAVARVLANFGLPRLSVVAPSSWSGAPRTGRGQNAREDVFRRARRTARKAVGVLEAAEVKADLAAALAGTVWACGTTSRAVEGRPRLSPRELGAEVARRAGNGRIAVVLGEEKRGLSDSELTLCSAVCTIPTGPAYDSMNLAQAAAVLAYEIAVGRGAGFDALPEAEPARHETMEAFWLRMKAVLSGAGYLNPQNPDAILAEWRRLLARAEPTQREAELLAAAARTLERKLAIGPSGGTS